MSNANKHRPSKTGNPSGGSIRNNPPRTSSSGIDKEDLETTT